MDYVIDDEMLMRSEPIYAGDTMIASKKSCVITKEEFLACYNEWVSKEKGEGQITLKDTDAIRKDIVNSIQTVNDGVKNSNDNYMEDYYRGYIDGLDRATEFIDNAPIVDPKRPQAEWITNKYGSSFCSICGELICCVNYCPKCGAKMKKEKNENNR